MRFRIPRPPAAKKNTRIPVTSKEGKTIFVQGTKASRDATMIATMATMERPEGWPIEEDDVGVRIWLEVETDEVIVDVYRMGPKPKKKSGRRRDLDNMATTILDALSGVLYRNDRQVAHLEIERVYPKQPIPTPCPADTARASR